MVSLTASPDRRNHEEGELLLEERSVNESGLLVASPQMADAFFARTVVLLCDYNDEGALGLIINRITNLGSEEVLEQIEVPTAGGIAGPVHWGGPVQPGSVFLTYARQPEALLAGEQEALDLPVFQLSGGLWVSPSRKVIEAVANDADNPGAFLSLGYAGWDAGQLDSEIRSGSWIFLDNFEDVLFKLKPDEIYDYCIASLGVTEEQIWMQPIDE